MWALWCVCYCGWIAVVLRACVLGLFAVAFLWVGCILVVVIALRGFVGVCGCADFVVGLQYLWLRCWCQIRCAELFAGGFTLLGLFLLIVLVFIDSLHLYRLVTG